MSSGFNRPVLVSIEDDGSNVAMAEERVYTGSQGDAWVIPKGFRTDFATIPAVVAWAVTKMGLYTLAAIVHDLLCEGLNRYHAARKHYEHLVRHLPGSRWPAPPVKPTANAVDTDAIFYKIAREYGTDVVTANLLWVGVRWGALGNAARREGFLRRDTFWWWLGLSLAYAPVLIPATVFAVVGRGVLWAARKVIR